MILDLYEVLGIHPGAGAEEIKKAFRRVALDCHPDRNAQNRAAEERFKDANFAYSILGDPQRRKRYDLYRSFRFRSAELGLGFPPSAVYDKILEDFFLNTPIPWFGNRGPFNLDALRRFGPLFSRSRDSFLFLRRLLRVLQRERFFLSPWGVANGIRPEPGWPTPADRMRGVWGRALNGRRGSVRRSGGGRPEQPGARTRSAAGRNGDRERVLVLAPEEAERGTMLTLSFPLGDAWERLRVRIPPGVRDGVRLRIRNKGDRDGGGGTERGDLYLRLQVDATRGP